jgi:hypothetical protein
MTFTPAITLSRALVEPDLFGGTFGGPSFWTWRVVAKLIDGLPLTEQREVDLYEQCTGLGYDRQTRRKVRRLIMLAGRRAGKDRFWSSLAVWRAALCVDWRLHQSAGEGAVCILLGADKKQAAILRRYCSGLLEVPHLAAEVTRSTGEVTEFRNGASLEISTNDARLVRGRSAVAVLGSETCHWKTDEFSASSDEEVVGAAEPSMAMCPDGGILLLGSSVYRKRGYMYRQFRELHGNPDTPADTLVWFAPSAVMNPRLPQHIIDRALAENAAKARAEFLNVWREDLSDFIPLDAIEACTDFNCFERAHVPGVNYRAFADAAGGTGTDSFAFAVGHYEPRGLEKCYVLDVVREYKPRFVPTQVIAELAVLCNVFGITQVYGDRYAIGFHESEWRKYGVSFQAYEQTTSENFLGLLPLLLAKRVQLINNVTARNQIASLERRIGISDREIVGHPQHAGAHDDVAAAVAGVIGVCATKNYDPTFGDDPTTPTKPPRPGWQHAGFASEEAAEAYKARARAQFGRSVSFPWDGFLW